MRLKVGVLSAVLLLTVAATFQNCAGGNFTAFDGGGSSVQLQMASSSPLPQSGVVSPQPNSGGRGACAAGSIAWQVGAQTCSASYSALNSSNDEVVLIDNGSPTTGQTSILCRDGKISISTSAKKTCAHSNSQPPAPQRPIALKSIYTPLDSMAIVNTGVKVTEEIFFCIEDSNDSTFPCRNGDLSKTYAKVPQPIQPNSPDQELLWSSGSFYGYRGIDFTNYTIFFMRKNTQGVLSDIVGSATMGFRLPEDAIGIGKSGTYTSSGGSNTFMYTCLVNENNSAPAGYKSYSFSNLNCYYKITN